MSKSNRVQNAAVRLQKRIAAWEAIPNKEQLAAQGMFFRKPGSKKKS